jgi:hypothetical protein
MDTPYKKISRLPQPHQSPITDIPIDPPNPIPFVNRSGVLDIPDYKNENLFRSEKNDFSVDLARKIAKIEYRDYGTGPYSPTEKKIGRISRIVQMSDVNEKLEIKKMINDINMLEDVKTYPIKIFDENLFLTRNPFEFYEKDLLLKRNLINYHTDNKSYWCFLRNKNTDIYNNANNLSEEDSFKIFLKINGNYVLNFVDLIDKYFYDIVGTYKFCKQLYEKRGPHKKNISYYEVNDPIIVIYFGRGGGVEKKINGKPYVYFKEAQEDMIIFIMRLQKILGDNIDKYVNTGYNNDYRERNSTTGIFVDFLQPVIIDGPAYTKYFNKMINYCQGGYTESGKAEILKKNQINDDYFNGDITPIKKQNNASALIDMMRLFDGEYFYKKKNTYDILNFYIFDESIEKTKSIDFKIHNHLWTHSRSGRVFLDQLQGNFGDPTQLIGTMKKEDDVYCIAHGGLNFRYGIDSQYGEIMFIMNPTFFRDLKPINFASREGKPLNVKFLTNLKSREMYDDTTNKFTTEGMANKFEIYYKLKVNSIIDKWRMHNNIDPDYNIACNGVPKKILESSKYLYNLLSLVASSDQINELLDDTTFMNINLIMWDVIRNSEYQKEWCNYQIQICADIDIESTVNTILIPSSLPEINEIRRYLDMYPIIKNKVKIIETDTKNLYIYNYPNITPGYKTRDLHLYMAKDSSSKISLSPEVFFLYEKEYYKIIDGMMDDGLFVGGAQEKYKKYLEKNKIYNKR